MVVVPNDLHYDAQVRDLTDYEHEPQSQRCPYLLVCLLRSLRLNTFERVSQYVYD